MLDSYAVLEAFGRLELGVLLSCDLNGFARGWVAAGARLGTACVELAEAADADVAVGVEFDCNDAFARV